MAPSIFRRGRHPDCHGRLAPRKGGKSDVHDDSHRVDGEDGETEGPSPLVLRWLASQTHAADQPVLAGPVPQVLCRETASLLGRAKPGTSKAGDEPSPGDGGGP